MESSLVFQAKYIDTSQITSKISQDEQSSITCMICLGVVINPAECKVCETVFCSNQVMAAGSYKPCPTCKSISWKYGSEIHKSYKSKLTSLHVKCDLHPECKDKSYTYQKYLAHVQNNKLDQPVEKGYYQFYYLEKGKWQPYEQSINSAANLYLQEGLAQFTVSGYLVNIPDKYQTNIKTQYKRQIKMELNKDRILQPLWTAEIETNKYQPYGSQVNGKLQKAYQQFLLNKRNQTVVQVGKYYYQIDYKLMKQQNTISKTSRRIKRTMI